MKKCGVCAMALATALLGACGGGGGGGSGGGSSGPPVSGPAPTPTPSPTPTPTVSYPSAFDTSKDFSLRLFGAELVSDFSQKSAESNYALVSQLLTAKALRTFQFESATKNGTLLDANVQSAILPGSIFRENSNGFIGYEEETAVRTRRLSIGVVGQQIGGFEENFRYAAIVSYYLLLADPPPPGFLSGPLIRIANSVYVAGSETLAEDMPKGGTLTYATSTSLDFSDISSGSQPAQYNGAPNRLGSGTVEPTDLKYDPATGRLSGVIRLTTGIRTDSAGNPIPPVLIDFEVEGRLIGSGPQFEGEVRTSGGATGQLTGAFFGPQARELGLVFTLSRGTERAYGRLLGLRRN